MPRSVSSATNLATKLKPARRAVEELVAAVEVEEDHEAEVATENGTGRTGSTPGRGW